MEALSPAGTSSDSQAALNNALKDFQSILTEDERSKLGKIGSVQGSDTVMIFTAQLDRENQLRKGRGIASRLYAVLQSVQSFSTVVETFVSSHPDIAALVWGSIKLTMLVSASQTRVWPYANNHRSRSTSLRILKPSLVFSWRSVNNARALLSIRLSTRPQRDSKRHFATSTHPSSAAASMW